MFLIWSVFVLSSFSFLTRLILVNSSVRSTFPDNHKEGPRVLLAPTTCLLLRLTSASPTVRLTFYWVFPLTLITARLPWDLSYTTITLTVTGGHSEARKHGKLCGAMRLLQPRRHLTLETG